MSDADRRSAMNMDAPIDRAWLTRRLVDAQTRNAFVPGDVRVLAPGAATMLEAAATGSPADADDAFERARTPAGVLVPLIARPDGVSVLLTVRAGHLTRHPGQIAFPGGRHEPADASIIATALRETQEEIGLAPERIEILGVLPDYRTRTGYRVTPVVGWIEPPITLIPDPAEVADVFEVPLAFVLDPANHQRHHRDAGDERRYFYVLPFEDRNIWGATAAMLINLHHVLVGG
ncbi:MAG: CoA pyrophosphatase [Proteobacteria bacterium]|nr:CoA pyrophosphatase [Burkholderiales bacterium]